MHLVLILWVSASLVAGPSYEYAHKYVEHTNIYYFNGLK